jgi:hypothetical protein
MELTTDMVEAYRRHCKLLQNVGPRSRHFLPGWIRYEKNRRWENRSHCLWGECSGGVYHMMDQGGSNGKRADGCCLGLYSRRVPR